MLKSPKKNIWKLFIVIKMDWVHSKKSETDLKILLIQACHDSRCKLFQQPHEKKVYGKSWNNEFFGERKQIKFSISSRRLLFFIIIFFCQRLHPLHYNPVYCEFWLHADPKNSSKSNSFICAFCFFYRSSKNYPT